MKKIIDIIKEANTHGQHYVTIANYEKATKINLSTQGLDEELPEIGDVVSNGEQDMTVKSYNIFENRVGIAFMEFDALVSASQLIQMLDDGICWVK